jgi:rubrerythrin
VPLHHRLRATALLAAAGALAAVTLVSTGGTASANSTQVNQLLTEAAKTESAAYLQYNAYADAAQKRGETSIANVWRAVAKVEHQDHYTHEVTLANLYSSSDNNGNLKIAIAQAQQTAKDFETYAGQVPQHSAAHRELSALAGRERADASLLQQALNGNTPTAPHVTAVAVTTAKAAKYSGTTYSDLTKALSDSAWNWAEYQWMAKTAVDTGNAKLAALFGALENQEAQENWVSVSNVAGYVNGTARNLQESIKSEQGAEQMYTTYAQQAKAAGNATVADAFTSIKGDEHGHEMAFTSELHDPSGAR